MPDLVSSTERPSSARRLGTLRGYRLPTLPPEIRKAQDERGCQPEQVEFVASKLLQRNRKAVELASSRAWPAAAPSQIRVEVGELGRALKLWGTPACSSSACARWRESPKRCPIAVVGTRSRNSADASTRRHSSSGVRHRVATAW